MSLLELSMPNDCVLLLERVLQKSTYEDLMIGSPGKRFNDFLFKQLDWKVAELVGNYHVEFLAPTMKIGSSGEEALPNVLCIGVLRIFHARHNVEDSRFAVVWFEDSIEPHISLQNLEKMGGKDWGKVLALLN